jgi:hypothetical protein
VKRPLVLQGFRLAVPLRSRADPIMSLLKRSIVFPLPIFAMALLLLVSETPGAQAEALAVPADPMAEQPPNPGKDFSESDLKAFINSIFLTAQGVRPELRAAGLRQLASVIVHMDTTRALWVYEQAFRSAEQVSAPDKLGMRETLEREIILDEAKLDLSRAVAHALILQPEPPAPEAARSGEHVKLVLLADLARRIPAEDTEALFQKIAPVLVQEDVDFDQTLTIAEFFQKTLPDRSQQLFSQAVGRFNLLPAEEALISTFASLTRVVGISNPALVEMGVEVLLKKADEVDATMQTEKSDDPEPLGPQEGVYGPTHLLILSQFLPLMQKSNPARAREWMETLQDKRNQDSLKHASTRRVFRADGSPDPHAVYTPGSSAPSHARPRRSSNSVAQGNSPTGSDLRRGTDRPAEDPDQPTTLEQMMNMGTQPPSAFSLGLNQDLIKAQTLSKNHPVDFSHRLEEILPRLQLESNPQSKSAALAQIALAYFQMGEAGQARKYLNEGLAQSEQGDSRLLRNSTSPPVFFSMYSATSNALTKLTPLFPKEATEATQSISDTQLRLRVMIDLLRVLTPLLSTPGHHSSPNP